MPEETEIRQDLFEGYNGPPPGTSQLEEYRPVSDRGFNGASEGKPSTPPPPPPPKK